MSMAPRRRPVRRESASTGLAVLVCVLCAIAPELSSAAPPRGCPDRQDPDADYLCRIGPSLTVPGLTDLGGWDEASHYSNILYGDIDGDGADEMVARGTAGVEVYEFRTGVGQWSQVAVPPVLPDRDGWDQPRYYRTIQLGDIDGDRKDELIARSKDGVIVHRFAPGRRAGSGSWTRVTSSGPFKDADGWGSGPKYYSTIRLSPIGRRFGETRPTMQLIGRGGDGLLVYRWTGSEWLLIARLTELSDSAGWDQREYYSTIMAWDSKYLVARGPKGLGVYELIQSSASPTDTAWRTLSARGPCQVEPDQNSYPCDTDTIQLVRGLRGVRSPAWPVVLARDPSGVGLRFAVFNLGERQWLARQPGRSPWWPGEYDHDQYRETIQTADVDGDGFVEVIGRSEPGTLTMDVEMDSNQNVRWSRKSDSFGPLLTEQWARQKYFRTITTARLHPDSRARSLVARGPYGVRTWRFKEGGGAGSWGRYRPYGNYPELDGDALDRLSEFLRIARGTVRDVYTEPGRDPSVDRLQGLQGSIAARCSGARSANPDQYERCTPPPGAEGISEATWTEVSNQIIAELYWARQVIDHFAALDDIQSRLFLDQSSQFPSMVADLKIESAQGVVARVDYQRVLYAVIGVLGGINIPGVSQVAGVITSWLAIAEAGAPVVTGEEPSEFEHTYAQVQRKIATIQQEVRDAITAKRRYVLGDYGLLATVGRLVASGTWELDGQAAVSAGRQAFTRSMYEAFLPVLWDRWFVKACLDLPFPSSDCVLPNQGPLLVHTYMPQFKPARVDFQGLVPRQTPCTTDIIRKYGRCDWLSLEQGFGPTLSVLLGSVTPECRYSAAAGTSWRYGCGLGIRAEALMDPPENSAWATFRTIRCDMRRIGKPEHCLQRQPGG
jgi:hypothetical protein